MLLLLSDYLQQFHSGFALFKYLTFRTIISVLSALALSLLLGPSLIRGLAKNQIGQHVREDGPKSHLVKTGTPTMGGILILLALIVTVLLCGDLTNRYIWSVLLTTIAFGVIGFIDDYRKLVLKNSEGLKAKWKYLLQSIVGLSVVFFLYYSANTSEATLFYFPFIKDPIFIGPAFVLLAYFVIVGSSNAVNLTDGLDGLAIVPCVLIAAALGIFAYLTGNSVFSNYLIIPHIPGVGEMSIFCGAICGSGLGFLWFNTYPAQVFMGDIGALALGAALGLIAVIVRQEIVYFIMAGVFVVETVSVMLQVASFKLTGKRLFKMAPLHHHFELKNWPEPRVIVRFWIVTVVLVLVGLATLKVR